MQGWDGCQSRSRDPYAFVYAGSDETNLLGIVTEEKERYEQCEIATTGIAKVLISDRTVQVQ